MEQSCIICGTPRSELNEVPYGVYRNGEWLIKCKPCSQRLIDEQIKAFEDSGETTDYEDDIICPYCGSKHEADSETSAFYTDGEHDFDCGTCSNSFTVETMVSFTYSTHKKESTPPQTINP